MRDGSADGGPNPEEEYKNKTAPRPDCFDQDGRLGFIERAGA
jgi:hypothetical protein